MKVHVLLLLIISNVHFMRVSVTNATRQEQSRSNIQPLASGYDAAGMDVISQTSHHLSDILFNGNATVSLSLDPFQPVTFFSPDVRHNTKHFALADKVPNYEIYGYKAYIAYLPRCTHFVDVGVNLGSHLFYAAQLVDFAVGIEADPLAYTLATTNLALNKNQWWSAHTVIQPGALVEGDSIQSNFTKGHSTTTIKAAAGYEGRGCSGIGADISPFCSTENIIERTVNSYSLPHLLQHYDVPANEKTFIKIDIESYECQLVPSLLPWLLAMLPGEKPTFRIEFHHDFHECTSLQYLKIMEVAALYKRVFNMENPGVSVLRTVDNFMPFPEFTNVIFTDI
jgi:FkbM family methyltransferase